VSASASLSEVMIYYDAARDPWKEVVARCGLRYELVTTKAGLRANIYNGDQLVGDSIDIVRSFEWLRTNGYAQPRKYTKKEK
jgi:hypothetical protein